MAIKKQAPRVRRGANQVLQMGIAAFELSSAHSERLDPRLPPAMRDGLANDLTALGVVVPGALQARSERKAATAGQHEAAQRAKELIIAMRGAVAATAGLGADVRKAWGVGVAMRSRVVKSVLAAGDMIVTRATARPDEARAAGILDADVEALREALALARSSDAEQEQRKLSAKAATAARDATLRRITEAVQRIRAIGQLTFIGDSELARKFDALVPSSSRRAPKPSEPAN